MKKLFRTLLVITTSTFLMVSCSNEDDFAIADFNPVFYAEDFPEEDINFNQTFDFEGWTNFAETGTKLWIERDFNNDGYIQFSSFLSGETSNIGWAITPSINIEGFENVKLSFQSATNFVDNPDNKLEVLVSNNFDGTNVLAATWEVLPAVVADNTTNNYTYIPSGEIDLSNYNSGPVHIAFRVTGNGSTLDGLFQVDKIRVYSLN